MTDFDTLIKTAVEKGATDIHISSSIPPRMRVNEELLPMRIGEPLDFALITSQIQGCLDEVLRRKVERSLANFEDVDFSFTIPSVTRVRANMYTSTSGRNIALRLIPLRRMTCDQIGIPDPVCQITDKASGLFIVTGPNGAGKTSTLAALIDRMNETRNIHILTLEDPVEYVFESKKALINQREIGTHSPDFAHALRSSVRENPDVLILGEMRDLDATRAALELAETGHLVFATLHTRTSISTVDRLISLFPADEQPLVRNMIAGAPAWGFNQAAYFSDFWLEDGDGVRYERGSASGLTALGDAYLVESPWFADPGELTLHIAGARWLDRELTAVTVDLAAQNLQLLNSGEEVPDPN